MPHQVRANALSCMRGACGFRSAHRRPALPSACCRWRRALHFDPLLCGASPGRSAGDYASPFRCPLDFLLPIEVLDRHNVSYRAPGFLDLPQVPPEVRASRTVLDIADIQPNDPDPEGATSLGAAGTAWTGMPEFALPLVEANVGRTYVLELRGELPGLLLSWDEASDAKAFDALFEAVLGEAFWCCFTWGDHDEEYRVLFYAAPEPYANNGAAAGSTATAGCAAGCAPPCNRCRRGALLTDMPPLLQPPRTSPGQSRSSRCPTGATKSARQTITTSSRACRSTPAHSCATPRQPG